MYGGIDIGGSKIEARFFDASFNTLAHQRLPTRSGTDFIANLCRQIDWLLAYSGNRELVVGLALPGMINFRQRCYHSANLDLAGIDVISYIEKKYKRQFFWENDCRAFAFSEARDGGGGGYRTVFGLIIGSGMAAGLVIDGKLHSGSNNIAIEIGHLGITARQVQKHKLPLWECPCGKIACYENYVAGPGIAQLYHFFHHQHVATEQIFQLAKSGDTSARQIVSIWLDLMGEVVDLIQLTFDPEIIVLGGGISLVPNIVENVSAAARCTDNAIIKPGKITGAKFGDSSGARGIAMLAQQHRASNG